MKFIQNLFSVLVLVLVLANCSKTNDPTPSSIAKRKITINDATAAEGNQLTFTVSLDSVSTDTVKFSYVTQNVTTSATDYYSIPNKVTVKLNPGQTTTHIIILTKTDTLNESSETFKLVLSDPKHCVISDSEGLGTITNVAYVNYFMKAKINGVQWNAIVGGFFGAEIIGNVFGATGTDGDSQLSFIFYQDPAGPKTYGFEANGASSDANLSSTYTPHFYSTSGLGTTWNGQPGGQFTITSYNTVTNIAEGTFSFSGKASDNSVVTFTEGSFKVPISN